MATPRIRRSLIATATLLLVVLLPQAILRGQQCATYQVAVDTAQKAIQSDVTAMKNIGFATNVKAVTDWGSMTGTQLDKLKQIRFFNFLQAASAVPLLPVSTGKVKLPLGLASISTSQAQALYTWASRNGLGDEPILEKLISGAASISDKPREADFGKKVIDTISTAAQAKMSDNLPDLLGAITQTALSLMAFKNPVFAGYATLLGSGSDALSLLSAGAEFSVARSQIDSLAKLNETELKTLNHLAALSRSHVSKLSDAQSKLASCMKASRERSTPGLPTVESGKRTLWRGLYGYSCSAEEIGHVRDDYCTQKLNGVVVMTPPHSVDVALIFKDGVLTSSAGGPPDLRQISPGHYTGMNGRDCELAITGHHLSANCAGVDLGRRDMWSLDQIPDYAR